MELIYFTALYSFGYILCYINNMDNDQLFSYINLIVQHSVKLQTEIQDMQKEIMRLSNIIDNQALAVESMLDEMLKKDE